MLKAETQTKLKQFTLNQKLILIVTINDLEHKLLQVLIFLKQSAIENNLGP